MPKRKRGCIIEFAGFCNGQFGRRVCYTMLFNSSDDGRLIPGRCHVHGFILVKKGRLNEHVEPEHFVGPGIINKKNV